MTQLILVTILNASILYQVDPYTIAAVIKTESEWNTMAVGKHGEKGLMQLRPQYFGISKRGEELHNPIINIHKGTSYLKEVREACKKKLDKGWLVCYNRGVAGGTKVAQPSKDKYVLTVKKNIKLLKQQRIFEGIYAVDFKPQPIWQIEHVRPKLQVPLYRQDKTQGYYGSIALW
jgi:soluble lytic murein transglycosylase-like protein